MTTTITREERERVLDLLGFDHPRSSARQEILAGLLAEVGLDCGDIDRVAQALRDAEGETLRKVVDNLGGDVHQRRVCTVADLVEIVEAHEDRAHAKGYAKALRDAAPQWREVTETEPAIGERVLIMWADEEDSHPEVATLDGDNFRASDAAAFNWKPTHWMPLPPPPKPDHSQRIAELEAEIARLKAEQ